MARTVALSFFQNTAFDRESNPHLIFWALLNCKKGVDYIWEYTVHMCMCIHKFQSKPLWAEETSCLIHPNREAKLHCLCSILWSVCAMIWVHEGFQIGELLCPGLLLCFVTTHFYTVIWTFHDWWLVKLESPHSFCSMIIVSSGKHYYWVRFIAFVLSHLLLLMCFRLFCVFVTDICKFLEPKRLCILKINLTVHGLNVYDSFVHPS